MILQDGQKHKVVIDCQTTCVWMFLYIYICTLYIYIYYTCVVSCHRLLYVCRHRLFYVYIYIHTHDIWLSYTTRLSTIYQVAPRCSACSRSSQKTSSDHWTRRRPPVVTVGLGVPFPGSRWHERKLGGNPFSMWKAGISHLNINLNRWQVEISLPALIDRSWRSGCKRGISHWHSWLLTGAGPSDLGGVT